MFEKKNKKKNRKYSNLKKLKSQENNVISSNLNLNDNIILSNTKIKDKIKDIKKKIDNRINSMKSKYWIYNIFMINYKIFFLNLKYIFLKNFYLFKCNKNKMKYSTSLKFNNKKEYSTNFFYKKDEDKSHLEIYCKNHIYHKHNTLFKQIKYRIKISYYSINQLENEILKYFDNKIINKNYHKCIEWLVT